MHSVRSIVLIFCLVLFALPIQSDEGDGYEGVPVASLTLEVRHLPHGVAFDQAQVVAQLETKAGDRFSQFVFDQDLKLLAKSYTHIEPIVEQRYGQLTILIKLDRKPVIREITFVGNKQLKTKKLRHELQVEPYTLFDRTTFKRHLADVRELYIKKGFFEAELSYSLIPDPKSGEVEVEVHVTEGRSGYIEAILFEGVNASERKALLRGMRSRKHNFFTSWLTGSGIYYQEILDHDELVIVNYLQNRGYANARAKITLSDTPEGRLKIDVKVEKGERFYFGAIGLVGHTVYSQAQIESILPFKEGDPFSPELIRDGVTAIQDLYGMKGYIEAQVGYSLTLSPLKPVYRINFQIEENEIFRIGLIRIVGNRLTNKNVILRESLLVPGELFDSRRLKATEQRLEAMGYFKSVNIYATPGGGGAVLGPGYRDVVIEVEEQSTGSANLFFGFSTRDSGFVGLELSENNFDHRGFARVWKEGFSSFRGAGEFFRIKAQLGKKSQSYGVTWMDPYFRDTSWRLGLSVNYGTSRIQSDDYRIDTLGGSIFTSYPFNPYWTFGLKLRLRNSIIKIHGVATEEAQRERQNSGLVLGLIPALTFDSTDNPFKPHHGFRSVFEVELAQLWRHGNEPGEPPYFPFLRLSYLNAYYYPVWARGTLKIRWDAKFIFPFAGGEPDLLPLSERFFLGGEQSVRGYKTYTLGPKFRDQAGQEDSDDPTGGVSSMLLSFEYLQSVHRMLDLFLFFDGGTISLKQFDLPDFRMSYGGGARLYIGRRLPVILGVGIPINPADEDDEQRFFISMAGQF